MATARGRTRQVLVRRVRSDGSSTRQPDELAVEEPMEIHLDGTLVATTMRTPGHDYELAVGWCHTEGLLGGEPVTSVRYCATRPAVETSFNVVTVGTDGRAPRPTGRLTIATSSCGLCGSESLLELAGRLEPLDDADPFEVSTLLAVPSGVRELQPLYGGTGAVHAAAAFDRSGNVEVVREDIGRHNAVDKVVGRLLLDGRLPASDLGLYVSGRASFELVQKAWAAGFRAMVAVSAPSSLAVETAVTAGMQLVGFVRAGEGNVYSPG